MSKAAPQYLPRHSILDVGGSDLQVAVGSGRDPHGASKGFNDGDVIRHFQIGIRGAFHP